ncbi:hypothetical protein, conserved [Angomonas deanei]|uniref:Uncharacterized protein n=1 Tax=Angomonas deanei TaxID=59799 RepID=A0A7G2CLG6_9TRYP|nr:hypothetical protein, conserved [Angomonas deanei]
MSRVLQASLLVLCVMLMTCRGEQGSFGCDDAERCVLCPDPSFCQKCIEPYEPSNGKCVEKNSKPNCGVMCAFCTPEYGCAVCKTGSFQTSLGGKFVCEMCGQNCAACTSAAQCNTCVRGAAMKKGRSCLFYINESRQLTTATAVVAVAVLLLSLTL